MAEKAFSNVIGFDDAPFDRHHRGRVQVVGAVFAGPRFDGVLVGDVEKDGSDAAASLAALVSQSKFAEHTQLVMLQGITLGGFNVVDAHALSKALSLPVLVVSRKLPDMDAVRNALLKHIRDGSAKWDLIAALGPMEPAGPVYVQRVGLSSHQALAVTRHFALHSHIPEPLRVAHLIAGALSSGQSRGNP
jgi:endonuclease V-like protein UPF0215 family